MSELFFASLFTDETKTTLTTEATIIIDGILAIDQTNLDQFRPLSEEKGDEDFVQKRLLNIFLDNLAKINSLIIKNFDRHPSSPGALVPNEPYDPIKFTLIKLSSWLLAAGVRKLILNQILNPNFTFPIAIFYLAIHDNFIVEYIFNPLAMLLLDELATPEGVESKLRQWISQLERICPAIKRFITLGPGKEEKCSAIKKFTILGPGRIDPKTTFETLLNTLLFDESFEVRHAALKAVKKMVLLPLKFVSHDHYSSLQNRIVNRIYENLNKDKTKDQKIKAIEAITYFGKLIVTPELLKKIFHILQTDASANVREKAALLLSLDLPIDFDLNILRALLEDQDSFWISQRNWQLFLETCSLLGSLIFPKLLHKLFEPTNIITGFIFDTFVEPFAFALTTLSLVRIISIYYRFWDNPVTKLSTQLLERLVSNHINRPDVVTLLSRHLMRPLNPTLKISIIKLLTISLGTQYNEEIYSMLFELLKSERNKEIRAAILTAIASTICSKEATKVIKELPNLKAKLPNQISPADYKILHIAILTNIRKKIAPNTFAQEFAPFMFDNINNTYVLECLEQVIHFFVDDDFIIPRLENNLMNSDVNIDVKKQTLLILGKLACLKPMPKIEHILIYQVFTYNQLDIKKTAVVQIGKILATQPTNTLLLAALFNALDEPELMYRTETLVALANLKSAAAFPAFISKLIHLAKNTRFFEDSIVDTLSNIGPILTNPQVIRFLAKFKSDAGKDLYHKICLQMIRNLLQNDSFEHVDRLAQAIATEKYAVTIIEDKLIIEGPNTTFEITINTKTKPKIRSFVKRLAFQDEISPVPYDSYRVCIERLSEEKTEQKSEQLETKREEKQEEKDSGAEFSAETLKLNDEIKAEAGRLKTKFVLVRKEIDQKAEPEDSYSSYAIYSFTLLRRMGSFCWSAGVACCRQRKQIVEPENLPTHEDKTKSQPKLKLS